MNNGNFKIKCIKSFSNEFHVGKEYDVIEGNIYHDGGISVLQYSSVEQINQQFCSKFELVEEGGKNMSKWNGKIKCVGMADKSGWANYTKGKIYDVKNGVIITDSGMSVNGESFEYFCDKSCARWE